MAACNRKSYIEYSHNFVIKIIVFSMFILSFAYAGEFEKPKAPVADSALADSSICFPQIDSLAAYLKSGKPTLAYFYYSVACSCTAARCAIAAAAIDSIHELRAGNDSLNFIKVDAYFEAGAEKLFNVPIIPAIVYYDNKGAELNRLEWGTNVEAITTLIHHPEIRQRPVD